MATVHYVKCAACLKEFYLDRVLFEAVQSNPKQQLKCPFCKKEFRPDEDSVGINN